MKMDSGSAILKVLGFFKSKDMESKNNQSRIETRNPFPALRGKNSPIGSIIGVTVITIIAETTPIKK